MVKSNEQYNTKQDLVEPTTNPQRDKLDKRLSELELQALSLEERADYAEKEAQLRKRIQDAQDRIRATQSPGAFDGMMGSMSGVSPVLGGIWGKIPGPFKMMLIMGVIVVVLLVVGKYCMGSG